MLCSLLPRLLGSLGLVSLNAGPALSESAGPGVALSVGIRVKREEKRERKRKRERRVGSKTQEAGPSEAGLGAPQTARAPSWGRGAVEVWW